MLQQIDLTQLEVAPTLHWMEAFGSWLHQEGKMPKTVMAYLQDMRHFDRWYQDCNAQPFSPDKLTRFDVQRYFEWQAGMKARAKSRNRRLASLRVMVRWAMEHGLLSEDPTVHQKRIKESRLPRRAKDDDEVQALAMVATVGSHLKRHTQLWSTLGLRDHVMWSLFIHAALRIEELANLDVDDLKFDQGIIRVIGKGGVDGEVEMADELKQDLQDWLTHRPQGGTALLTDWHGQRLTTGQLRRRLKQIGESAGVTVNPHDLRHSSIERVGRAAIQKGLSNEKALYIMQHHGRHADQRTTLGYLRPSSGDFHQAVNGAAVGVM